MFALFLMSATAVASAPARGAPHLPAATPAPPASPARVVIEAQLRSPPRTSHDAALTADEADAIYRRYLASIGQRPDRAPDSRLGSTP